MKFSEVSNSIDVFRRKLETFYIINLVSQFGTKISIGNVYRLMGSRKNKAEEIGEIVLQNIRNS